MKKAFLGLPLLCLLALFALSACSTSHEHTLLKTDAKEPTCTESGNHAYFTCTDCGKVFADAACTVETTVEAQTIALLSHDWGEVCYEINSEKTECTATRTCQRDDSHIESESASVVKEGFLYQASFENEAFADYRKDATPRITAVEFANTDSACYDAATKTFTVSISGGDLPVFKVLGENLEEIYGGAAWTYYFQYKDNLGVDLSKKALTFADGSATYALEEAARRSLPTQPYEIVFTNDGETFTSTGYYIRLAVNENARIDSMSFNSDSPAYDAASATFTVSDEIPLIVTFTGTDICGSPIISALMGNTTYGFFRYTIEDGVNGFTVVDEDTAVWTLTASLLRPLLTQISEVNVLGYTNDGTNFGGYIMLKVVLAE